jgi:hypothetical protein
MIFLLAGGGYFGFFSGVQRFVADEWRDAFQIMSANSSSVG